MRIEVDAQRLELLGERRVEVLPTVLFPDGLPLTFVVSDSEGRHPNCTVRPGDLCRGPERHDLGFAWNSRSNSCDPGRRCGGTRFGGWVRRGRAGGRVLCEPDTAEYDG